MTDLADIAPRLDRLAEIAVRIGVNLAAGQQLIINAPLEAAPLVRAVAAHAYRAGASVVVPLFADQELARIRVECGDEASFDAAPGWLYDGMAKAAQDGAAMLTITGANPNALAGCDPVRVGRVQKAHAKAARGFAELARGFAINWSIAPYAGADWARAIFPGVAEDQAVRQLWEAIFAATRVDAPDPVAAWQQHVATLQSRAAGLTAKRFERLHFRGPGTDLHVGLVQDHIWAGGAVNCGNGIRCFPNIPTEEVFTMPHRERVWGTARASKPLSYAGTLIEGIEVRFEEGRIVQAEARSGVETFRNLIAADDGAARLGEVALVPEASPIAQSGLLFQNTLFDENAACHIAVGKSFAINAPGDRYNLGSGANDSLVHVDWMIGSAEIDVDGVHADGSVEAVMRAGAFV